MEKEWAESFEKENAGKTVKRVSKIMMKCQRTDKIMERQKKLLEEKFSEFAKFVRGDHDSNLRVSIYE